MALEDVLRLQDGVLSRRQVLLAGFDDARVERMIRRRNWARVFEGVYVDHTGPLTWSQRAWAATLVHEPAALSGASALRAFGIAVDGPNRDIELVVAAHRRVDDPSGVRTSRARDFADVIHPLLQPPRMRIEVAGLVVASRSRSADAAVAVLADLCQQRRTTPDRLLSALRARPRVPRRQLLETVLDDVAAGSYSALERRYLMWVERPHGLPIAARQRRVRLGARAQYRDIEYLGLGVVVELDGRLGHERATDRWSDLDRDLSRVLLGDLTVRVGWRQVLEPCRLAAGLGRLLRARGWTGTVRRCGDSCST